MPDIDKRKAIIDMPLKKNVWDVVSYVWNIFKQAIDFGASDIHIEPMEHFLLIRFRQDGDFHLIDKVWRDNISAIVTRLKVLSKIKIDENKKPQAYPQTRWKSHKYWGTLTHRCKPRKGAWSPKK